MGVLRKIRSRVLGESGDSTATPGPGALRPTGAPSADRISELKWEDIPAAENAEHPTAIDDLLNRTRDGITVTGVFSPEVAEAAIQHLEATERVITPAGALHGMSLGMIGADEPDRSRYYDDTERVRKELTDAFGVDPHDRIAEVIEPMAGGRRAVPPSEDERPYNPGQTRWWKPGGGGLRAHIGNEFLSDLRTGAMSHLITTTQVQHHLSYFVVLRPPEDGGALSVYDLVWEDFDGGNIPWENCERDDAAFDNIRCTKVSPAAGDMIIFGGGYRWHRVDQIGGTVARVTHGGFCAPSTDGAELHFWA